MRCSARGIFSIIYLCSLPIVPCTVQRCILANVRLCKFASTARLLLVRVIIDLTFSHVRLDVISLR